MTDHEVFMKALGVIERKGWTRGTIRNSRGQVCTRGALATAVYGMDGPYQYGRVLERIERKFMEVNNIPYSVPNWNDNLDTDNGKQVVIDALHKAAFYSRTEQEAMIQAQRIPKNDLRIIDSAHHFYLGV